MVNIRLHQIQRSFSQGNKAIVVLKNINCVIEKGERIALVGFSGSGKSTLLQIIGLLDTPNTGEIWFEDQPCHTFSEGEKTLFRRRHLGFVYQFHHLLSEFTSLENVVLPQLIQGTVYKKAYKNAEELLKKINLGHRLHHRPSQLSGGEQQRVAIARALVTNPDIILADEPTGNLDPFTAGDIFNQLTQQVKDQKTTLIMATHNLDLAKRMDRTLHLRNGSIEENWPN